MAAKIISIIPKIMEQELKFLEYLAEGQSQKTIEEIMENLKYNDEGQLDAKTNIKS